MFLSLIEVKTKGKFWEQVESAKYGNETIWSGNLLRIEPVSDEILITSGKNGSNTKRVSFKCTLLGKETAILYNGMRIWAAGTSVRKEREYFRDDDTKEWHGKKWPKNVTEQMIELQCPSPIYASCNSALREELSGMSDIYFYLGDKDGECISNIIKMQVKFE